MRKISFLIACLSFSLALNSQTPTLPSDGEGINPRTEKATFWINPMGLQPSVFLSPTDIDTRTDRKWWRSTTVSPLNYAAIEESLEDSYASAPTNQWQIPQNSNLLIADPFLIRLWQLRRSVTRLSVGLL